MKTNPFFFMAICLLLGANSIDAKQLKIKVKEPGSLSTLIGNKKDNTTQLTLSGVLNSSDLRFLREMAGSDVEQRPTEGKLRRVDFSKVTFTSGGEPYINKDGLQYTRGTYTIPKFLFRNCPIEEIIFPERTDTIDTGAFEYTQLKKIQLPENIVINDWAFSNNPELEEIIFPSFTKKLKSYSLVLENCNKLKQITINDVGNINGNCLSNAPALEVIEIKGFIGHIDGYYTINKCPKLKQVDFQGAICSTGGPSLFTNCPELQSVIFHGPINRTYIGEPENCPLLTSYETKDIVFYSHEPKLIPYIKQKDLPHDTRYRKALNMFSQIVESLNKRQNLNVINSQSLSTLFYDAACHLSLAGSKKEALNFLETAVVCGYNNYYWIKKDSDLIALHNEKKFEELVMKTRETGDFLYIIQKSAPYERSNKEMTAFTYAPPSDTLLTRIRNYFKLDSIAGKGDDISQIKNLLYWLHESIRHDGNSSWPKCKFNAIELYELAKKENRGFNCRFLAMMLNDLYLAMGYKSRFLTCQSKAYDNDQDCHVINVVWSPTLKKWIWMDPSFAAYVTDENGLLLHPGEVRERLINKRPLVLNEDANWNHQEIQTKEHYLETYMAKNLYLISAHINSESESEGNSSKNNPELALVPKGFSFLWGETTNDDTYFWQAPQE